MIDHEEYADRVDALVATAADSTPTSAPHARALAQASASLLDRLALEIAAEYGEWQEGARYPMASSRELFAAEFERCLPGVAVQCPYLHLVIRSRQPYEEGYGWLGWVGGSRTHAFSPALVAVGAGAADSVSSPEPSRPTRRRFGRELADVVVPTLEGMPALVDDVLDALP